MASDNLIQVGKFFRNFRDKTEAQTRRYAENFPRLENTRDYIGVTMPFQTEFHTTTERSVYMSLFIDNEFEKNPVVSFARIPLTITPTGLSIGKEGDVASENEWVAVGYLGDLNFEGMLDTDEYSAIMEYEFEGTYSLEFKIVFEDGGVDLTDETDVSDPFIIIPLQKSNVIDPSKNILYDVYIYVRAQLGDSSWVHFSEISYFRKGANYIPRKTEL